MTMKIVTNFNFADDIVVNAEEEEEADVLVDRLNTTTTRYNIEIGPDKTKVMTNNPNGCQREIKIKGQRLEGVKNFKYLRGYPRQQQLFLDRRSYGGARISRLLLRLSRCGRSSYPPSFMPVRAGP